MIRKSIYLIFVISLFYFGFVYLVAIGFMGNYEGPGIISTTKTPDQVLNNRFQNQFEHKKTFGV